MKEGLSVDEDGTRRWHLHGVKHEFRDDIQALARMGIDKAVIDRVLAKHVIDACQA